jgi:nitroreductase
MSRNIQARKLPDGDHPSDKLSNPVLRNIYGRRSVRRYKPDPVPYDVLLEVIKAGTYAPTARNQQPWRFVVITDKAQIDRYSGRAKELWKGDVGREIAASMGIGEGEFSKYALMMSVPGLHIFHHAPAVVLIFAPESPFVQEDCACAAENMMLAARSLGLGSCWIGFARPLGADEKTRAELRVPEGHGLKAALVFGFPANDPGKAPARNEDVIINWVG